MHFVDFATLGNVGEGSVERIVALLHSRAAAGQEFVRVHCD
jgi:hypothetical protein